MQLSGEPLPMRPAGQTFNADFLADALCHLHPVRFLEFSQNLGAGPDSTEHCFLSQVTGPSQGGGRAGVWAARPPAQFSSFVQVQRKLEEL